MEGKGWIFDTCERIGDKVGGLLGSPGRDREEGKAREGLGVLRLLQEGMVLLRAA